MTVIIDRGSLQIRAGAPEKEPLIEQFISSGKDEDALQQEIRILRDRWDKVHDPDSMRVISCMPLEFQIHEPAILCQHYFEAAGANSVCLVSSPYASAVCHGLSTALVCDFGHNQTRLTTASDGMVHRSSSVNSYNLSGSLQNLILRSHGFESDVDCHKFKVKYSTAEESEIVLDGSVEHVLPDGKRLNLKTSIKKDLGEFYFSPDKIAPNVNRLDAKTLIQTALFSGPASVPLETLQENIVVSGGISAMNGFIERLSKCLGNSDSIKIWRSPKPQYTAWRGCSILSQLPAVSSICVSRSEYNEHGPNFILKRCL